MKKYFLYLFVLLFFSSVFAKHAVAQNLDRITTIEDGKLKVAVTGICKDNSPRHNCWVYKIFSTFVEKNNLTLELIPVEFDKSWELANANKVDVVATGITPLPERSLGKATYSYMYSIVKRGIKIKRENEHRFRVMADFIGQSLAAVKEMTSEKDLRNRALPGINIITPSSFAEVYALFNEDKVAGIAEGFYFFPDDPDDDFNSDEKTTIVDVHDLIPGEIEGNRFVVRNASKNLRNKLNDHIESLGLPNHRPRD